MSIKFEKNVIYGAILNMGFIKYFSLHLNIYVINNDIGIIWVTPAYTQHCGYHEIIDCKSVDNMQNHLAVNEEKLIIISRNINYILNNRNKYKIYKGSI